MPAKPPHPYRLLLIYVRGFENTLHERPKRDDPYIKKTASGEYPKTVFNHII